jgi:hypothetical protein
LPLLLVRAAVTPMYGRNLLIGRVFGLKGETGAIVEADGGPV